jgi:hypothetical protein
MHDWTVLKRVFDCGFHHRPKAIDLRASDMTNKPYYIIALSIALLIALEIKLNDGLASLFLARKFLDLLQVIAFWR